MDRLKAAIERRCKQGAAVRLVNRAADEPAGTFKEVLLQRRTGASARRERAPRGGCHCPRGRLRGRLRVGSPAPTGWRRRCTAPEPRTPSGR